jgi:nitrate/TMAO reductase-like tetraheme cytochrome c subunit
MSVRKIFKVIKKHIPAFIVGVGFAVLCFVGLNAAMEPFSTSAYCGGKCHEMQNTYRTWEISEHAAGQNGVRIECIDCHLPPKEKYFTHLLAKGFCGAKGVYKHYFGGEYDLERTRKKVLDSMRDQTCVYCHDNLLTRPSGPAARIAHVASLARPDSPQARCLACHEQTGHQRKDKTRDD